MPVIQCSQMEFSSFWDTGVYSFNSEESHWFYSDVKMLKQDKQGRSFAVNVIFTFQNGI